jgi:hypothetical protein
LCHDGQGAGGLAAVGGRLISDKAFESLQLTERLRLSEEHVLSADCLRPEVCRIAEDAHDLASADMPAVSCVDWWQRCFLQ